MPQHAKKLQVIGFDADDTLWHNERFFQLTQERFVELLADYTERDTLMARLLVAERNNLGHYGFGVKGFVLSMIETAIDVTDGQVPAAVISELLDAGRDMLEHPIDLLPFASDVVGELSESHHLILITKGDLLDQERKLAQSGLGDLFNAVEIVSDKTSDVYERIFGATRQGARASMMVGNSLKSDVLPAIDAGSWGVHIPHEVTWELEHAEKPENATRFAQLKDLSGLPSLVEQINS